MPLDFEPIVLDRQAPYRERLSRCPRPTSDYSFINLWGWTDAYALEWAWEPDLVWIRQRRPEPAYWAPVGDWTAVDWAHRLEDVPEGPLRFTRIPEPLMQAWQASLGPELRITEARGDWDYIYDADDLSQLSGNRFHKKKNLVNQFKKRHDYLYRNLESAMIHKALDMQADWCTWRDCEAHRTLAAENRSIEKVLRSWDLLEGILGGALTVDDRMVAYTVAEKITETMLLIHFEKADPEYKGAYQAINQIFISHCGAGFGRVNREQDLDDPGLRKAKLSYQPIEFLKKFNILVPSMSGLDGH